MGIKFGTFGFDALRAKLKEPSKAETEREQELIRWLSYIGEDLCNHARTVTEGHDSGGYNDHTGNLRSSIGYRILRKGEAVKDGGFGNVTVTNEKGETVTGNGIDDAKTALDNYGLAHEIPVDAYCLVIVAGMSYATYVEAKGYNVLHLTNIKMKEEIEKLKKDLGLK